MTRWNSRIIKAAALTATALIMAAAVQAAEPADESKPDNRHFEARDVFELEYAADPQISPDGSRIVYVRRSMDIMKDRARGALWIIGSDGSGHRPLTSSQENASSPRWSPDGSRLLYVSDASGSRQIHLRWMDTGQTAQLTHLTRGPSSLAWSPDGEHIAFNLFVPAPDEPFASMPAKPEGAEWAPPAKVIDDLQYRADGAGFLEDGDNQIFVLPAGGGTPRQLTSGAYSHGSPVWSRDSKSLLFSGNRRQDWQYDPLNSEIYEVSLEDASIKQLTSRQGPDNAPALSPDGKHIAYLGFDDRYQGFQVTQLYVMNRDGSQSRSLTASLDRSAGGPVWAGDGSGLFFQYSDKGNTKVGFVDLQGNITKIADNLGGTSLGRPYGGGSFSVSEGGRIAYTYSRPDRPADLAVAAKGQQARRLTGLNEDLFGHKTLGAVEEIWYESSFDQRQVQGWIVKPPDFDPSKKYPLVLEIHGGPFSNYGDRFSAEIQLYASAGYVVLYTNPRGSTSYGQEFGNLIHHNYPGEDYDDLMSGVDAVIEKGYVDPEQLFVTGGSGGGVLTSWIVGKTGRFKAAVVAKPVINWYSFVLTADAYNFFYKYWFPGFPWDHPEHYLKRSPLSLVGNVTTPTMLLTGEADYRTPMSESEQFYQALKLRKVDSMLVRIPQASHGIARRPSNLITKVNHILAWFEKYRTQEGS
ncbi:MAG TPA: S9 family peptidase [Acidobacteriota bacterium]|nr:S9 family peptidase [Acidobacteriota bacterium]